jgi:23S rRNA pseudouridine2457 synthase
VILFHKPYGVLCQFTDRRGRPTLADHIRVPDVYPAGRLDFDSEGLVVLSNDIAFRRAITDPGHGIEKVYWVQVEGLPSDEALARLAGGIVLKDGPTRPARARRIEPPPVGPRTPPIRERKSIPVSWLSVALTEGRNRQVRRMTAAVGHPTLRLVRVSVGPWSLGTLKPGESIEVPAPSSLPRGRADST